jgi:uncharacterized protein (UPF0333 family)
MKPGNIILLVICLIAIVIGMVIYFEASAFQKTAKITEGTVASSDATFYYVKYTSDDGVERTFKGTHSKNKKHFPGDRLKVFYQADDPDKSRISDGVKGGKKVIIFAVLLLIMDIYLIITNKKKSSSARNFKANGRKVEAEIMKIYVDEDTTFREKHPYLIECRWVDPITGREYAHTIRNIWTDPKPFLAGRSRIDVYIDRQDPEKYFMDIEFLGDLAQA